MPATALTTDLRTRAACRGTDPELFFPLASTGPGAIQADEAKQVCAACPVRVTCLGWAIEHLVADGVWGGLTGNERQQLRQNQAGAA